MKRIMMGIAALALVLAVSACLPPETVTYPTPSGTSTPLVVGDSITWQAAYAGDIQAAHPEWRVHAYMGWRMEDVRDRIISERDAGTLDTLVVALGTNDANPTGNGGWTQDDENTWSAALLNLHQGTKLVLVKPWLGPNAPAAHRIEIDEARSYIDRLRDARPNTVVVDWAQDVADHGGPGVVLHSDHVHLAYGPGGATDPTDTASAARIQSIERGLA